MSISGPWNQNKLFQLCYYHEIIINKYLLNTLNTFLSNLLSEQRSHMKTMRLQLRCIKQMHGNRMSFYRFEFSFNNFCEVTSQSLKN